MQQVILTEPENIEIRDVPEPEPSEGEVVIRVHTALTSETDLKAYVGGHRSIPMPGPFGHEYSGTIAKTGKGVNEFKEGDSIMGVNSAPCLACKYCGRGLYNLCEAISEKKVLGAFSDYLLLPSHIVRQNLFHKPAQLSFGVAALLEPFSRVVHPYGKLRFEGMETALVSGAGPMGLMHLAYLNMKGISVIVSEQRDERLALAAEMGAARVLYPEETGNAVREITDGMGVDLVIECTGHIKAWEDSVNFVRRGGYVILFAGCPAGTSASYDTRRLHNDELTLAGSFQYSPQDVQIAYYSLMDRTVDLSLLISAEFPLNEIKKVFSLLEEGKGIKYALRP